MCRCVSVIVVGIVLIVVRLASGQDTTRAAAKLQSADPIPDILFIPTPNDVVDRMLELAGVHQRDTVYDLGCGDGRIVVAAAKKHGCRAVGFDIDPRRVKEAQENVKANKVEHLVHIEQRDLFDVDLAPASVVMVYLSPKANVRLIPQFEKLKPGARIVSHEFEIRGAEPTRVIQVTSQHDKWKHTLFLWTPPLVVRR